MRSADLKMGETAPEQIRQALAELEQAFVRELAKANAPEDLEQLRIKYLGRKSVLAASLKHLGRLPPDQRAAFGKTLNSLKTTFESHVEEKQHQLRERPALAPVDVTLPGVSLPVGRLHPITQTLEAIVSCFVPMGFEVIEGPELEYEWHNFDALNIPKDHPSREAFDTFFVDLPAPSTARQAGWLLRKPRPVTLKALPRSWAGALRIS